MARRRGRRLALGVLVALAVAAGLALVLGFLTLKAYRIPSSSMEPTLHCPKPLPGCQGERADRVAVTRLAYALGDPGRGDLVAYVRPPSAAAVCGSGPSTTSIGRIVVLPGESWEDRRGRVYVDGRELAEPYVAARESASFPERTVPDDAYVVMGDNRPFACDSRRWGPVPRDNLIGKVVLVYFPPDRIGFR